MTSEVMSGRKVSPPESWRDAGSHYRVALTHPWYRGLVDLQDAVQLLTSKFWAGRGVKNLHLPITTGSISSPMGLGSDSSPVKVNIGGVETYLADSMQFMLEFGVRLASEGTYYVMPSFRGEDADNTHLCQFFHSEAEIPGGLEDIKVVVEEYLRFLVQGLLEHQAPLLKQMGVGVSHLQAMLELEKFRSISFEDAVRLVGDTPDMITHIDVPAGPCRSLTRRAERKIMEIAGEFTWVTHLDHLSVPFYQGFGDADGRSSLSGDLLFGIGETVGAGERHRDATQVRNALQLHGVDEHAYEWYLGMREETPLQTSGFGMGIERFLLWVLGHDDIRDLSLLVRFNGEDILP